MSTGYSSQTAIQSSGPNLISTTMAAGYPGCEFQWFLEPSRLSDRIMFVRLRGRAGLMGKTRPPDRTACL
jgi:hypothetical protein